MRIHFVCTGNTFRSRMAEAYLKSKKIEGIEVSSSGVEASYNIVGPITWYAKRIINNNNLIPDSSLGGWTQTTKDILNNQDLIIFMQKWHYDQSIKKFDFKGRKFEVWDIEDVKNPLLWMNSKSIAFTEGVYEKIKLEIDSLIARDFKPRSRQRV